MSGVDSLSELDYLSIELFIKPDEVNNKILVNEGVVQEGVVQEGVVQEGVVQEGGVKKRTKEIILSDSITSIENLSDTSESEDSKFMIREIAEKLKSKVKDID